MKTKPIATSRREIWVRLLLYPLHTLPTAAAPVIVAIGLAIHDGIFAWLPALVALVGSWLIHLGGVIVDNHELLRRHRSVPEHPELTKAISDGTLLTKELKWAIVGSFALPLLVVPYVVTVGGVPTILIGVMGVIASFGYAGQPLSYASRGWADAIFFLMFGIVAVAGTYYLQMASVRGVPADWNSLWESMPGSAFLVGLPVGALVTNVLIIDDIRDREFDAKKGWRTTAVRFGLVGSRAEYLALLIFAYFAPFWIWLGLGYSVWVLLPLFTLLPAGQIAAVVMTKDTTEDLYLMTPKSSMLAVSWSALLAVGLALS